MKRGSFVGPRKRLNRVSQKVKKERPWFDEVYRFVDARSSGRCEIIMAGEVSAWTGKTLASRRCPSRATDHHHLRKPRRHHHLAALIVHLCRTHHDMTAASYRVGRLEIALVPGEPAQWVGRVVQKASKWAP